jgi:glutaminase
VNTKQLADIGVMLAQNGMTRSGEKILEPAIAKFCMVQLMQAGLYEESGDFFGLTGIAAKSGVSGGIVAVAHKKMAIGLFSPKLNAYGNSVRGIAFLTVRVKIYITLYRVALENHD